VFITGILILEFTYTRPDRLWGPPSLPYNGYWSFIKGVNRLRHESNHSPTCTGEVENWWSYISAPSIGLHRQDMHNFAFTTWKEAAGSSRGPAEVFFRRLETIGTTQQRGETDTSRSVPAAQTCSTCGICSINSMHNQSASKKGICMYIRIE
jgi:hypothetical protein